MSRWLLVLAGVQTALILALVLKVFGLEDQVTLLSGPGQIEQVTRSQQISDQPIDGGERAASITAPSSLNESQLRRIVAEEIRAAIDRQSDPGGNQAPESESPEVSEEEYQARLEHALSQIEYYVERGEITPAEMANLQQDIARLDEENRSEVLRLLVTAVSAGRIEGEL